MSKVPSDVKSMAAIFVAIFSFWSLLFILGVFSYNRYESTPADMKCPLHYINGPQQLYCSPPPNTVYTQDAEFMREQEAQYALFCEVSGECVYFVSPDNAVTSILLPTPAPTPFALPTPYGVTKGVYVKDFESCAFTNDCFWFSNAPPPDPRLKAWVSGDEFDKYYYFSTGD